MISGKKSTQTLQDGDMPSDSDLHQSIVGEPPHTCQGCESRLAGISCDLDGPRLAELDRLRQVSVYPTGTAIYMEGDLPRAAYCVCSGSVSANASLK